ncbi:MAG: replicative DNA helicase [Betaproteobacteria bacterium]|nr:replicative DNA helicase [Betaproteobacteria bacterium]
MAQAVTPITRDPQIETLKLPPYSLEAEQSVLGGLLLDNSAWEKIADAVSDADFYRADHRQIYRHISVLIEGNKPADALTVAESLERSGKLEEVGGQAYLGSLAVNTPSAANIRRYAEIVRERAIMRRLAEVGTEITESVFSPLGRSAKELLDNAEKQVFAIAEAGARGQQGFREIQPLLTEVVERIDTLYKRDNPSDVTGIPTGFTDLDRMTSGLQPGDLVVVAGRPSMGKTAFALNVAEHVALVEKMPAAIFSMEMSGTQLVMRMLGSLGRLDQHKMRTGSLNDDDWQKLTASVGRLSEAPVFVDESGMLNPTELRGRARRLHRQQGGPGLGLIVVDYLQLMETGNSTENRATEVAEISRSLKAVAKELNVPVMALSQLNRGLEQRPNKRPVMSDLRECVVGETLVMLTDGRRVPVNELVGTEPEVWAMSQDRKIVSARSDKVWSVGVKPIFRLTLASGKVLRATAKHRVYGSNGWVRVEELRVGDRLATARNVPEPRNTDSWDESDLALLGHLVGDGSYLTHQPLRYTTASEENSRVVAEATRRQGAIVNRHEGRGNWHQLVISGNGNRWHPRAVNLWLRRLGIYGQRSHDKRLPDEVFRLSNTQVAMLLRHLWATDGSIYVRDRRAAGSSRVYFSTASEGLARDVNALLLRFGIVGRIRAVHDSKGHRPVFTVDVSGADQQRQFLSEIGAFGPRCEPARKLELWLAETEQNTNVDTLPQAAFQDVKAVMQARGVSQRKMASMRGTSYGGTSHFNFSPSREVMRSYADLLDDSGLRLWAEDDIFWDRVVEVRPDGIEEVFDLTVPGPASWLADGIVSHNSGAIEQDADLILFIYRDEVYNPESPDKGTAEIIIGKQRNGPIGTIKLTFLGQHTRFENFAAPGRF